MTTMHSADADRDRIIETLRRDPLRNLVFLKFARLSTDGGLLHRLVENDRSATLLLVDHAHSAFDRETYPEARASVFLTGDAPTLTRRLLDLVPRDCVLVFKLESDADRAVVEDVFSLERCTSYHSFHSVGLAPVVARDRVGADHDADLLAIFRDRGHDPDWLSARLEAGTAMTAAIEEDGHVVCACFAFEIDAAIWEIGGVFTRPEARRRGLSRRIVLATLAALQQRGVAARYQAAEDNPASLRLAEAVGLRRYLTLTHYLARPRAAG